MTIKRSTFVYNEYGLVSKEDGLDSMGCGVPAKIGPYGVEKICELQVDEIREEIDRSAAIIKEDIKIASEILREKF